MHIWLLVCMTLPMQSETEAASAPKDVRESVRQLIRQLDADERDQRQAAEDGLLQLGPEILGLLPPITPRTPAEAKVRLERVRKALETELARVAAEPTRVTLRGEMPLSEALAALTEQTGNAVRGYAEGGGRVTADWEDVIFWRALDGILDQVNLNVDPYGGMANTLVLRARPDSELDRASHAVYSGAFRFEPIRLNARRDIRNSDVNALTITYSVAWEPRMRPISLRQRLDSVSVVDDLGQTLPITQNQYGVINAPIESDISAVELVLPVALPERRATRLASVKGTMTAIIPSAMQDFEFTELATSRDVEHRNAGVAVIYEGMRKNGDLYEIRVRLRFDEAEGALQSHLSWVSKNEAYVTDAAGQRQENLGMAQRIRSEDEVGFSYLFDLPQGPDQCTFVYRTPALVMELPVEYELNDLPLP